MPPPHVRAEGESMKVRMQSSIVGRPGKGRQRTAAAGWLAVVALGGACSPQRAEPHAATPQNATQQTGVAAAKASEPAAPAAITAYPPGRWRLAPPRALASTVLWVSHILVRHEHSVPDLASFSVLPMPWTPEPPLPVRTRAQALERATVASNQARSGVASFAALAQRWSEDVTTSGLGGSLGGIAVESLYDWPQLLDALAALQPGEVSAPVETEFGFHVLQLREPPKSEQVSGQRIVIGYDEAPWLRTYLAAGELPHRSRSEAERWARELYDRARNEPGAFVRLLRQYSEHRDLSRDGDLGTWSSREASPFPREIERLQGLRVGEIAPPIDSPYGFQILLRTSVAERPLYAAARIQWQSESTPVTPEADAQVREGLQKIADLLARNPERFEEFQNSACCAGVSDTWQAGRGSAPAEAALARLHIGEIAAAPVREGPGIYALLKRAAPGQWKPAEASLALPAPARPDVMFVMTVIDRLELLEEARSEAITRWSLEPAIAQRLAELQALRAPWQQAQTLEERRDLLMQLRKNLTDLLGPRQSDLYWRLLEQVVERDLLRPGPGAFPW